MTAMDTRDENDLFSHGSKWIRADFHLHTRKDKEFKYQGEENSFVAEYIAKLKEQDIRLGVITNHNKFDLNEFRALRKRAKKEGIYLLPGVELSVNDGANGIHMLIVFSEKWLEHDSTYIEQFLTSTFLGHPAAEYENENQRSNENILQTIDRLNAFAREYFIIFAHVENNNGFWRELDGGRIAEFGQQEKFKKNVAAFQKVRTYDKAESGSPCRRKVKGWLGDWYPAEIEGSDCKAIDEIGRGKHCYIKIGEFTFDAVRFALKDHESHVASAAISYRHSYIESISFEGGKLNGKNILFSPELNTFIGIRGSGKSSVLESLRYALDIPNSEGSLDHDYKDGLVEYLLRNGGKVIVKAVDRRGTAYEVRRIFGERPEVYVRGVLQPGVSILETVLHRPIYFGQKDLSGSGENFEQGLVEKLLGEQLIPIRSQIEQQRAKVKNAADAMLKSLSVDEKIAEVEEKLQDAQFKMKLYQEYGVEEKLQKQLDYETDMRYFLQTEQKTENFLRDLTDFCDRNEDELKNQKIYQSKQNQPFVAAYLEEYEKIVAIFTWIKTGLQQGEAVLAALRMKSKEFAQVKSALKDEFAAAQRQLAEALANAGAPMIKLDEYRLWSQKAEAARAQLTVLKKQKEQRKSYRAQLLEAIEQLNNLWNREYQKIISILEEVNGKNPVLQIKVDYQADKETWFQYFDSMVKGSNIRRQGLQKLIARYDNCGAIYQDIANALTLIGGKAESFEQLFMKNLGDLLTWQVPNQYRMEYKGKELKQHSLGQRASALILFVLSQADNDVFIIDQPEDDLDNQTIYEDVVKLLCQMKHKTQFIFATHNANFPVLGDAEQILVCTNAESEIRIESGSIDAPTIQDKVIAIMEGGKEAFHKRKEIYHIWTQQNS